MPMMNLPQVPLTDPIQLIKQKIDETEAMYAWALSEILFKDEMYCREVLKGKRDLTRKDTTFIEEKLGITREQLGLSK